MLNFPQTTYFGKLVPKNKFYDTYFGKLVPKNKFYDKLTIDKKLERSFIDQITSIRWVHKLSADTLNVEKGSTVQEVEVFLVKLKTPELDINVLKQMDRQLPYHLIFILEFDGKIQVWTSYKEESTGAAFKVGSYYHTDWVTEDRSPEKRLLKKTTRA